MRLREKPIYLSTEVWRALWILAKAEIKKPDNVMLTPDEIADDLLRQAIREQHPDLITHLAEMDASEKQLIERLRKK